MVNKIKEGHKNGSISDFYNLGVEMARSGFGVSFSYAKHAATFCYQSYRSFNQNLVSMYGGTGGYSDQAYSDTFCRIGEGRYHLAGHTVTYPEAVETVVLVGTVGYLFSRYAIPSIVKNFYNNNSEKTLTPKV